MSEQQPFEQARVPGPNPTGDTPAEPLRQPQGPVAQPPPADAGLPPAARRARLHSGGKGPPRLHPAAATAPPLSPHQRLLLRDTWRRSGLPAADFADLVGLSKYTLYDWKRRFEAQGPGGLLDQPKGG